MVEIASDAIETAKELLEPLGAQNFVVEDLDENVASLFAQDAEPEAEPSWRRPRASLPPSDRLEWANFDRL